MAEIKIEILANKSEGEKTPSSYDIVLPEKLSTVVKAYILHALNKASERHLDDVQSDDDRTRGGRSGYRGVKAVPALDVLALLKNLEAAEKGLNATMGATYKIVFHPRGVKDTLPDFDPHKILTGLKLGQGAIPQTTDPLLLIELPRPALSEAEKERLRETAEKLLKTQRLGNVNVTLLQNTVEWTEASRANTLFLRGISLTAENASTVVRALGMKEPQPLLEELKTRPVTKEIFDPQVWLADAAPRVKLGKNPESGAPWYYITREGLPKDVEILDVLTVARDQRILDLGLTAITAGNHNQFIFFRLDNGVKPSEALQDKLKTALAQLGAGRVRNYPVKDLPTASFVS